MSDKLKRVLDTNLAGLHVTDAQVNAVLRRVSQDEKRPRVIRWQAIAAVLLVLVLGAGACCKPGFCRTIPRSSLPTSPVRAIS